MTDYKNTWVVPVNRMSDDDYPVYFYRFYRLYKEYAGTAYYINEIEIEGVLGLAVTSQDTTCDLTATYKKNTALGILTYPNAVEYSSDKTGTLINFSPKSGSSLGGSEITFEGSGFGDTSRIEDVKVLIDNIPCEVTFVQHNRIICTAGARPEYTTPSLSINIINLGNVALHDKKFLYAERWSDERTWGGEVAPIEGETV